MAAVVITWMDGRGELVTLNPGDRLVVKERILSVVRARYPAREDKEMAENFPLVNVRSFVEYE
jgi:hypothetical protein